MRRLVWMSILVAASCASQQRKQPEATQPEAANGWTPVQEAELHGRCVGGWLAHDAEPSAANALCGCVTPRLTRAFPYSWFNDGKEMSPSEARTISDIHVACAKELALSTPGGAGPALGPGEAPDQDQDGAPDPADEGTGSGQL